MTRVRAKDLGPKARKQLELALSEPARPKRSRAGTGNGQPCPGRCGCGRQFPKYTAWERHSDELGAGHRRWAIDLPEPAR